MPNDENIIPLNPGSSELSPKAALALGTVAGLLTKLRGLYLELQQCAETFKQEDNDEAYCATSACADRLQEVMREWLGEARRKYRPPEKPPGA